MNIFEAAECGHLPTIRWRIVNGGVDVNATDEYGWTALMRAADGGYLGVVRYLVSKEQKSK